MTALPWYVDHGVVENGVSDGPTIFGDADKSHWAEPIVARMNGCDDAKANAAFIVRACNAHDELVALLHECLGDYGHKNFTDRHGMADRIRAALAKVKP